MLGGLKEVRASDLFSTAGQPGDRIEAVECLEDRSAPTHLIPATLPADLAAPFALAASLPVWGQ
jgi:hypothetical protein